MQHPSPLFTRAAFQLKPAHPPPGRAFHDRRQAFPSHYRALLVYGAAAGRCSLSHIAMSTTGWLLRPCSYGWLCYPCPWQRLAYFPRSPFTGWLLPLSRKYGKSVGQQLAPLFSSRQNLRLAAAPDFHQPAHVVSFPSAAVSAPPPEVALPELRWLLPPSFGHQICYAVIRQRLAWILVRVSSAWVGCCRILRKKLGMLRGLKQRPATFRNKGSLHWLRLAAATLLPLYHPPKQHRLPREAVGRSTACRQM